MEIFRTTSHTKYDNKYHLVWITKYRRKILIDSVGRRARDLIRQVCENQGVVIIKGNVSPDHVHLFVSIPPHQSVSQIVQRAKGKSSYQILREFSRIKKICWGDHFWAIGYFCATSGHVTDEMIVKYIEKQGEGEEDDPFQVTP